MNLSTNYSTTKIIMYLINNMNKLINIIIVIDIILICAYHTLVTANVLSKNILTKWVNFIVIKENLIPNNIVWCVLCIFYVTTRQSMKIKIKLNYFLCIPIENVF